MYCIFYSDLSAAVRLLFFSAYRFFIKVDIVPLKYSCEYYSILEVGWRYRRLVSILLLISKQNIITANSPIFVTGDTDCTIFKAHKIVCQSNIFSPKQYNGLTLNILCF